MNIESLVEDLMLYGWGLTNDSSVKFTSSSGNYGDNCKTNDSKKENCMGSVSVEAKIKDGHSLEIWNILLTW